MLWKCCTQYASKFGKLSSGHRTGKDQSSFQSQRKAMPKNAQTTAQLHSSHMLVRRRQWHPTPVFWPREFLRLYSPWGSKELDITEWLSLFFGIRMKTDLFRSCGHCWVFQVCWHVECSTLIASSFRIWNSSTGIPSPPLALFIVMLPKAHLTSNSRMSGSRWVITPSWLSGSFPRLGRSPGEEEKIHNRSSSINCLLKN